ncbi:arf-GAP with Rho-GAP domain, ANK repeat and PH domain-containing protein 1 [Megalops cyprinoides]|uniref:arf-GAP with Rho-GAP domain, ANK repeat and PH domain-containing protein 1 n=1 Tax=Megalops cyprinoides TaxID=118141 RepID=UPI001864DB44|nr:arf-GAP with Rho-GAP domain, ANK repeat and PH domain-containing protein 1 [Megalops cyprinoides]
MTTPIPKPRGCYRLGVAIRTSVEGDLLYDVPDSETAGKQDGLQGKLNSSITGTSCTSASVGLAENGDKPVILNSLQNGLQAIPTVQDTTDDKRLSDISDPRSRPIQSHESPSLNPSAPPVDSSMGIKTADESGQTSSFNWPDSPPPSPTEHLDCVLKNLSEWATDPGDDTPNEEEFTLTPATPKSEDDSATGTQVREGTKQPKEKSHSDSSPVSSNQASVTNSGQPPQPGKEQATMQTRPMKQKAPRTATIRVSRKKQGLVEWNGGVQAGDVPHREGVVSRSSWLDVWQGRKHHVLWATLDGQLMSLWKKRTEKFTEVVFHVSSITNVRAQDRSRFSIYFGKKHIEFMAHSEAVQDGWVSSLHASRGQDPPLGPEQHGQLTMKDPRTKVYAAIYGHNLWIYRNREDFGAGLGMLYVSMNVASVKQTGRHSFNLITPYKTFSFSADSSRELAVWLGCLTQVIRNALSCSEVAQRLWASPWNKVCADCGCGNPEWASVNLLVVICEACAGQHRSMGINISKVRSLKMDSKVWTEPLIQLFVLYGNKVANDVWAHNVPAAEQILPDVTPNERNAFVKAKYIQGRYRRAHPLASSQKLLNQRLCEVVVGPDIPETMSLLCSGARVLCHSGDPQFPSPISLAEHAGQAMQTELLRHNEYTDAPVYIQKRSSKNRPTSTSFAFDPSSTAGQEELHGKLEDDLFLFSQENDSAACDVLDLREVMSIFDYSSGGTHRFEMLTLTDELQCNTDTREELLLHLTHILKVVLPGSVQDEELEGVHAVSRVSMREGGGLQYSEVWVALRRNEMLIYPTGGRKKDKLVLTPDTGLNLDSSENTIELVMAERTVSMQFERDDTCCCWDRLLRKAVPPAQEARRRSLYQLPTVANGKVPPAVERCISHITQHGLKVDGIYRRCGMATKIAQLVEELTSSPTGAQLETSEMAVLDTAGALKQILRQQVVLIPEAHMGSWVNAAAHTEEAQRLDAYRRALNDLPPDNRATLSALCEHFYMVQLYSHENRMTAQNLALVFVPTLFQDLAMNTNMVRLTRELIIHYTLVFQEGTNDTYMEGEEMVTVF